MRKAGFFAALIFLGLAPSSAHAQRTDLGNWYMYFGSQPISKRWNWHNEVQYRNFNLAGDLEQLLLRTGIGYNLSESNNNFLIGYGFILGERYAPNNVDKIRSTEHRLFQQFITRQRFGRVYVQHRYRLEERFLSNNFRLRFRYFLSLNIPLNLPALDPKAIYLSAYNEVFVQVDPSPFDRNRIYGALGYVIGRNFRLELGAMSQMQARSSRPQFQIALFNTLPFYKQ